MSEEQIKAIAENLAGLKYYEWSRVKVAVERMYSAASAKIELKDVEEIHKNLSLELKGILS